MKPFREKETSMLIPLSLPGVLLENALGFLFRVVSGSSAIRPVSLRFSFFLSIYTASIYGIAG